MWRLRSITCFLSFILSVVLTSWVSARATTVADETFSDLVYKADIIAVGTVTGVQERWDATRQAPFTDVTFSHLTVLKGTPEGETITLEILGGHLPNGDVMSIAGVPQFGIGEKNVVFSAGNHRDFCPLVGIWQGRLKVLFDPQRGVETVSDNFRAPIIGVQDGVFLKATPQLSPSQALPLSDLVELIQKELGSAYGQR